MRDRFRPAIACLAASAATVPVALGGSDSATVEQHIGPSGNMPRNLVTGKDAQEVAAFVAANASGSSTP